MDKAFGNKKLLVNLELVYQDVIQRSPERSVA